MKEELPSYLALVADTDANFSPLEWWKSNSNALPNWSAAARKIFLIQPTSATVERVFSLLTNCFNDQQEGALQDYIECTLMLQFNGR